MRVVTQHLTAMIEEVLSYSSLEMGHESVRPSEFLADDIIHAVIAVVEPLARQKKLSIVADVPPRPIRLTSDIDKVRQVLVNLAGNAIKFTDEGEVRVIVGRDESVVRFTVRDTGAGLTAESISRLFQPFTQVDPSLTRRHGGTGLGLYISRRLAEILGGSIEVESEFGRGSDFTFTLPLTTAVE
jgi:signal transduction histidine kinase